MQKLDTMGDMLIQHNTSPQHIVNSVKTLSGNLKLLFCNIGKHYIHFAAGVPQSEPKERQPADAGTPAELTQAEAEGAKPLDEAVPAEVTQAEPQDGGSSPELCQDEEDDGQQSSQPWRQRTLQQL